jgi:hypothetical protein
MRALAPLRDDRYQSAEEMRQALADVMAEVAPRADTERVAGVRRRLYEAAIKEERTSARSCSRRPRRCRPRRSRRRGPR